MHWEVDRIVIQHIRPHHIMTEAQELSDSNPPSDSLCEVCHKAAFKYKCPGCFKRTCSLECSKQHKITFNCSGKAYDPLQYVSHRDIQEADDEKHESNHLIQRDFNFLTGMKRKLKLDQHDAYVRNKKVLRSGFNNNFQRDAAPNNNRCVMNRGVYCFLLPKKMSRSVNNRSRMDRQEDVYTWTVEWVICPKDKESVKHITHGFKETDNLAQGMTEPTFELCRSSLGITEDATDITDRATLLHQHNVHFYIKWFPHGLNQYRESRELIEVNAEKCMGEILKNRTVLEFPTVYVASSEADLPQGMIVIDETTKSDEERGLKSRYEGASSVKPASTGVVASGSNNSNIASHPKEVDNANASDDEAPEVASAKEGQTNTSTDQGEVNDDYNPLEQ